MQTVHSSAEDSQALLHQTPPAATPMRPPVITRSYRGLFRTFASHPNEWFTVTPEGIAGGNLPDKRRNLLMAARIRRLRLRTSIQNGQLFAKLIVEAEVR
jgi:hypothetical protein